MWVISSVSFGRRMYIHSVKMFVTYLCTWMYTVVLFDVVFLVDVWYVTILR